jgi:hypothetical protein
MSRRTSPAEDGSSGTSNTSTTIPVPAPRQRNRRNRDRISSEVDENTALIINIIAGAMVAFILILQFILEFEKRSDGSYRVDESNNYQQSQGPNTTLLGTGNSQQRPKQMNGNP